VDETGDQAVAMEPVLQLDRLEESLRFEEMAHDTEDREDHTFCGVMVDLVCTSNLPCEYVEVNAVWVRGDLGPLTVYTAEQSYKECMSDPSAWTIRHKGTYEPSFNDLVELKLEPPKRIASGESAGLYVHSTQDDDQAIVYDNMHHSRMDGYVWEEELGGGEGSAGPQRPPPALSISLGMAHLSNVPFAGRAPWGSGPWRQQREFVGRVSYGVRWLLWTPQLHRRFPLGFRAAAEALLMGAKHEESPLYWLRDEVIFYIMNRCGWDWFGTDFEKDPEEEEKEKAERAEGRRGACSYRRGGAGPPRVSNESALLNLLHSMGMHALQFNQDGQLVVGLADDEEEDDEEEDDEYVPPGLDEDDEEEEDCSGESSDEEGGEVQ